MNMLWKPGASGCHSCININSDNMQTDTDALYNMHYTICFIQYALCIMHRSLTDNLAEIPSQDAPNQPAHSR